MRGLHTRGTSCWLMGIRLVPFVAACILGCLSPIDFPVQNRGGQLVISGQISTLADRNLVQVGITADTERLPFPVSGATVILRDDFGNAFPYSEQFDKPGDYLLTHVAGVTGRSYFIEVTLEDGSMYRSAPEKMPGPTIIDSLFYEVVNEDVVDGEGTITNQDFVKTYIKARLLPSESELFVKWTTEETFILTPTDFPDTFAIMPPPCFIQQNVDPQQVILFDGRVVSSPSLQKQQVGSRIVDWSFLEKHYFTVYQSSLTMAAFSYWSKVKTIANPVNFLFDPPPGNLIGNIINEADPSEKILGYFQAVNQTFDRVFLLPADLPRSLNIGTCNFNGSFNPGDYQPRCINCLGLSNSTLTRPVWF